VRTLLVVAALATAAILGLLTLNRDGGRVARHADGPVLPEEPPLAGPAPPEMAHERLGTPRSREEVEKFLARCSELGKAAVPELARRLRERRDVPFEPRWRFVGGRLKGHPTLRSAYIAALAAIPGDASAGALREVLAQSASVFEAYEIALALEDRGEAGWAKDALVRAGEHTSPSKLDTQLAIVGLAAERDPDETAAQILTQAPRGDAMTDPKVLASGLSRLPARQALAATQALIADPEVTLRAKGRYLRGLFARPQLEQTVLRGVQGMFESETLSRELRTDAAYAAAGAASFYTDAIAYQKARAQGKGEEAATIKTRCERRIVEIEALIRAAIGTDVNTSSDPRAASLRRMLERHRARLR